MAADIRGKNTIEKLHEHKPHIPAYPLIEDFDQEVSVLFGINRAVCDLSAFLVAGFIITLDDRDELEISGFQFVAEKAVKFAHPISMPSLKQESV